MVLPETTRFDGVTFHDEIPPVCDMTLLVIVMFETPPPLSLAISTPGAGFEDR